MFEANIHVPYDKTITALLRIKILKCRLAEWQFLPKSIKEELGFEPGSYNF
jgi:hypothetical protein